MAATRINDENNKSSCNSLITLRELCEDLSVSVATGKNWVKLGKLTPERVERGTAFFTPEYVRLLKDDIKKGRVDALKSRRNKKYVSGNNLYNSYVSNGCKGKVAVQNLLTIIDEENIEIDAGLIEALVADCAIKLFSSKRIDKNKGAGIGSYLGREISFGGADELIDDLIEDWERAISFSKKFPELFDISYTYEKNEDIPGLIYISLSNMGKRKNSGAYYTPNSIVKKLIDRAFEDKENLGTILDPCCGTGNFLLQLPDSVGIDSIYGDDIDPVSVKIARINLALKYGLEDVKVLKSHITCSDFLAKEHGKYDHIIGNPPWGYEFSNEDKKRLKQKFCTAKGTNIESFDVFIENAVEHLEENGLLSFVLPESVLNVRAHGTIREFLLERTSITYLEYLGDAFDGVQCPSIIMNVKNTGGKLSTKGLTVKNKNREFTIATDRTVNKEYFSFLTTDEEYRLLEKLLDSPNAVFLKDNADFALGIVTGNNKEYISNQKNEDNEMVLKGSDIRKFYYAEPDNYIVFKPESFQQVAPKELYRAKEKLFYKFISNSLVFAYDDRQTLSLNSCNILIPRIEGLPIKYVLAVLNSSVAQFVYEKMFSSVKVLRSHIEEIPIPRADGDTIGKIVALTDELIRLKDNVNSETVYSELDSLITEIYGLTESEKKVIMQKNWD